MPVWVVEWVALVVLVASVVAVDVCDSRSSSESPLANVELLLLRWSRFEDGGAMLPSLFWSVQSTAGAEKTTDEGSSKTRINIRPNITMVIAY